MSLPNGILVLNKPKGITPAETLRRLKRITGKNSKIGYVGTLDPMAVGVLPILFGETTKLSNYLTAQTKIYQSTIELGVETDTLDIEGEITRNLPYNHVTHKIIIDVLRQFTGKISQIPPIFSAIKKNGIPLYKYARQNKAVEISAREVFIHGFENIQWQSPNIHFQVKVSSGTYIRSLARDIALKLDTCGRLTSLQRTQNGSFSINESYELSGFQTQPDIENAFCSIKEKLSQLYKVVEVDQMIAEKIRQGQKAFIPIIENKVDSLHKFVIFCRNDLIAMILQENEISKIERVFNWP